MATVTARELNTTALEGQVRGQLIAPDDPGYDEARQVYNAMIDKRPAFLDQPVELRSLTRVVADRRVDRVVDARRPAEHPPHLVSLGKPY